MFKVYDVHYTPMRLVLTTDSAAEVAALMMLDAAEVEWAIENCEELETDDHRLDVVEC